MAFPLSHPRPRNPRKPRAHLVQLPEEHVRLLASHLGVCVVGGGGGGIERNHSVRA